MTIAVCCTLADGVVLGTDSAITVQGTVMTPQGPQVGVLKVYNDAEKMFSFHADASKEERLPVGMVTFGMATIGSRTLQSYVREFELENRPETLKGLSMEKLCRTLHKFFRERYIESLEVALKAQGKKLEDVPENLRALGMFVSGFSYKEPLPETWQLDIQLDEASGVRQIRKQGDFGSNWGGQFMGVQRFHKGFDPQLLQDVIGRLIAEFKIDASGADTQQRIMALVQEAVTPFEYQVPFAAMPLQEGIDYATFLLDMMILQHRFVVGAPTCGGKVRMAVVRKHEGFEWVSDQRFEVRETRHA